MRRLRYWWGRVLCAVGRHDERLAGNVRLECVPDAANGENVHVVLICQRDDCWRVRFL